MSESPPNTDPGTLYEDRLGRLREQLGELSDDSLLAEDLEMLEEYGQQFRDGEKSAEDVANKAILVYWTHYMQLDADARINLGQLGFDFGRSAGVPVDRLAMHWNSAYELKDYDYLRRDVASSRLVALGKFASQ